MRLPRTVQYARAGHYNFLVCSSSKVYSLATGLEEADGPIISGVYDHLVDRAQSEADDEMDCLRSEVNDQTESIRQLRATEVDKATPVPSHGGYPPADPQRQDAP